MYASVHKRMYTHTRMHVHTDTCTHAHTHTIGLSCTVSTMFYMPCRPSSALALSCSIEAITASLSDLQGITQLVSHSPQTQNTLLFLGIWNTRIVCLSINRSHKMCLDLRSALQQPAELHTNLHCKPHCASIVQYIPLVQLCYNR